MVNWDGELARVEDVGAWKEDKTRKTHADEPRGGRAGGHTPVAARIPENTMLHSCEHATCPSQGISSEGFTAM